MLRSCCSRRDRCRSALCLTVAWSGAARARAGSSAGRPARACRCPPSISVGGGPHRSARALAEDRRAARARRGRCGAGGDRGVAERPAEGAVDRRERPGAGHAHRQRERRFTRAVRQGQRSSVQIRYTTTPASSGCACWPAPRAALLLEAECMAMHAGERARSGAAPARRCSPARRSCAATTTTSCAAARCCTPTSPMLAPAAMAAPGDVGGRPAASSGSAWRSPTAARSICRQSAVHWEIARMLLDFVVPRGERPRRRPAATTMVRQWYRATAAWMQLREDHDKLHLDRARAHLPGRSRHPLPERLPARDLRGRADPDRGALGRPADRRDLDVGIRAGRAARGGSVLPARARAQARPCARRGCATGACSRVLGQARRGGRRAAARGGRARPSRRSLYYAQLFLGAEEEALGNRDAARAAYEQAAATRLRWRSRRCSRSASSRGATAIAPARCARSIGCSRFPDEDRDRARRSLVVVSRRRRRATPTICSTRCGSRIATERLQ